MQMIHSVIEPSCFLRFGYVSAYDAKRHMARVIFPAMNNVVSAWLPVCVSSSAGNTFEHHLTVGTHVSCIMAGEGTESGIITGCIYDDSNKPHTGNENVECIEFSDGTRVSYDRENHSAEINSQGEITISAQNAVTVNAQSATVNASGDVTINCAGFTVNAGDMSMSFSPSKNFLSLESPGTTDIFSQDRFRLESPSKLSFMSADEINIDAVHAINIRAKSVNIEEG